MRQHTTCRTTTFGKSPGGMCRALIGEHLLDNMRFTKCLHTLKDEWIWSNLAKSKQCWSHVVYLRFFSVWVKTLSNKDLARRFGLLWQRHFGLVPTGLFAKHVFRTSSGVFLQDAFCSVACKLCCALDSCTNIGSRLNLRYWLKSQVEYVQGPRGFAARLRRALQPQVTGEQQQQ